MPRYRIRLEDPNSEHFRLVTTHADSEAAALANALRNEQKAVGYTLPPADLEAIEAKDPAKRVGRERGNLFMHKQAEPFKVVSVQEGTGKPATVTKERLADAHAVLAERQAGLEQRQTEARQQAADESADGGEG